MFTKKQTLVVLPIIATRVMNVCHVLRGPIIVTMSILILCLAKAKSIANLIKNVLITQRALVTTTNSIAKITFVLTALLIITTAMENPLITRENPATWEAVTLDVDTAAPITIGQINWTLL